MSLFVNTAPGLMGRLLEFNLLPSRNLHAERMAALFKVHEIPGALLQQPEVMRALHSRLSARLLAELGDYSTPVLDLDQPAMPLALLPGDGLARLAKLAGTMLIGKHLRHAIDRNAVLQARVDLGADRVTWAIRHAEQIHPGLDDASRWLGGGWAAAADLLGNGFIALAWQDAPVSLRLRADWRLSPSIDDLQVRQASAMTCSAARECCLNLLSQMEPEWLSNFHVTH